MKTKGIWAVMATIGLGASMMTPTLASAHTTSTKTRASIVWKKAEITISGKTMSFPALTDRHVVYVPAWYVTEALKDSGIESALYNRTQQWQISTPYVGVYGVKWPTVTGGNYSIMINGTNTGMSLRTMSARDPWSHKPTRYVQLSTMQTIINALGFSPKGDVWSGSTYPDTWNLTAPIPLGNRPLPKEILNLGVDPAQASMRQMVGAYYYVQGYAALPAGSSAPNAVNPVTVETLKSNHGYLVELMGYATGNAQYGTTQMLPQDPNWVAPTIGNIDNIGSVSSAPRFVIHTMSNALVVVGNTWLFVSGRPSKGYTTGQVLYGSLFLASGMKNNAITIPPTYTPGAEDAQYPGVPLLNVISSNGYQYSVDLHNGSILSSGAASQNARAVHTVLPPYEIAVGSMRRGTVVTQ